MRSSAAWRTPGGASSRSARFDPHFGLRRQAVALVVDLYVLTLDAGAETAGLAAKLGHMTSLGALLTMRRVDWPRVIGREGSANFQRRPAETGISVLSAADELLSYRDLETITRRCVEVARDRLRLERVALFLIGNDDQLYGSFGTGMMGETTDERDIVFAPGEAHRDAISRLLSGTSRWLVLEDVPLVTQHQGRTEVIGRGWNCLTPIRSRDRMVGLFANDAALTKSPLAENSQTELAVLATIVGNLFELKGLDAGALPWAPTLPTLVPRGPSLRAAVLSPDVRAAMLCMRESPALTTSALAKKCAVTPRALAKHFRREVGVSLLDYRNRLRIEKFLTLAHESGNLLEAALDAGFGSYAQFHRVFRQQVGVTPKEYLSRRPPRSLAES